MLKAKAKAAATAAAQKRKAAAAAAAAQEAAAQQAAQAAAGPSGAAGPARGGRAVALGATQYWADSPAARLAPGGGIQRIAYDAAAYDEAFRVVCLGGAPGEENQRVEGSVGVIPAAAEAERALAVEGEEGKEGGEGYKTNKEDLAVILDNLDVPSALASHTLRAHKGDLAATLTKLAAPRGPAAAQSA